MAALLCGCGALRPAPVMGPLPSAPGYLMHAEKSREPPGPPPLVPRAEPPILAISEPPKEKPPPPQETEPSPRIGPWKLYGWNVVSFDREPFFLNHLPPGGYFTYQFDLGLRGPLAQIEFEDWISNRSKWQKKNYLRAGLELFAFVGPIGTTWYWSNQDFNRVDWDLRWDQESWKRKIITFDAIRFDTNLFDTNAVGHSFQSGMWYHLFARANRLNLFEAFLFSFAASALWEYGSEFKELVSLNDLILTPVAGLDLGEVLFQYGEFFSRGHDKSVNRVLSRVFGFPQQAHAWLDGARIPKAKKSDRFGFPTDIAHQFEFGTGLGLSSVASTEQQVAGNRIGFNINTEIVTIPKYNQPEKVPWHFTLDNFTNASFRVLYGPGGTRLFYVYAAATLGGMFLQDMALEEGSSEPYGLNFFAGMGSAYEYSKRFIGDTEDRLAIVSLAGPVLDFSARRAGFYTRARLGAYADFAMIGPYSVMKFIDSLGERRTKSVLERNYYYFAAGVSAVPELVLRFAGLEAGFVSHFDFFRSIEGRDRLEELIDVQGVAADFRSTHKVYLAYVFPSNSMKLSLNREAIFRESGLSIFKSQSVEDLHFIELGLLF